MSAIVLTYHSHNISGTTYATNDHVAFAKDLMALRSAGAEFASLGAIADGVRDRTIFGSTRMLVGLSFDDGPLFDVQSFVHPDYGPQQSFLETMRELRASAGSGAGRALCATSFVIASREARAAMERAPQCGFPWFERWLTDSWWSSAASEGVIRIGNHSWDHVHDAPETIVTKSQSRGNFGIVDNYDDADAEIRAAADFIRAIVPGGADLFAYPYGHVNEYLACDYLPNFRSEHGLKAGFGVDGRRVGDTDSPWNIPRAVCGFHWRSTEELLELVFGSV